MNFADMIKEKAVDEMNKVRLEVLEKEYIKVKEINAELLEAARIALGTLTVLVKLKGDHELVNAKYGAIKRLETAIAKAEGGK